MKPSLPSQQMSLPQQKDTVMTRSGNDILLIFDDIMRVLECKRRQSLVVVVHEVKIVEYVLFL
jgi:hypothetical protein